MRSFSFVSKIPHIVIWLLRLLAVTLVDIGSVAAIMWLPGSVWLLGIRLLSIWLLSIRMLSIRLLSIWLLAHVLLLTIRWRYLSHVRHLSHVWLLAILWRHLSHVWLLAILWRYLSHVWLLRILAIRLLLHMLLTIRLLHHLLTIRLLHHHLLTISRLLHHLLTIRLLLHHHLPPWLHHNSPRRPATCHSHIPHKRLRVPQCHQQRLITHATAGCDHRVVAAGHGQPEPDAPQLEAGGVDTHTYGHRSNVGLYIYIWLGCLTHTEMGTEAM
jgi:hypothetical protein